MYRVTIYEGRDVYDILVFDEYPDEIPLRPGQWYDICRIPLDALDYEELHVC